MSIFRNFLIIFIAASFFTTINSSAKELNVMSRKLWQPIVHEDLELLKKIFNNLENKNYNEALNYAAELKARELGRESTENKDQTEKKPAFAEAIADIILWRKFSDNRISASNIAFSDISRFVTDNAFYPNINELKENVEKIAIVNHTPYQVGEKYFKSNPAKAPESKVYLLQAKIDFLTRSKATEEEKSVLRKEIQKQIAEIWVKENFTAEEEQKFLQKYQNQLTETDFFNRIDRLLWDDKIIDARRIMNFVNTDSQKLFLAVIELQNFPKNIDTIILSVPRKLRSNEGLAYRRVIYYKAKDKLDDLLDVMVDLPKKSAFPQKWWSLRKLYSREMLKQKKYKMAYVLMAMHSLPESHADYWEAEWTAGWISLRFLDEPKVAYQHFENLHKNVSQPVTLARSNYWLGMAAQNMGNKDKAIEWFKASSKYPTFFYGQLAIHKHRLLDPVGAQADIILPGDPDITGRDLFNISQSRAAQVAFLLAVTGDKKNSGKIFEWLVLNSPTEGQVAVVMKIVNEFEDRQLDARIARIAAKKNVFFIRDKFQIVQEVSGDEYAPLVHAIIKQESGFAPTALSKVGAVGFMQLMPDTAKLVCKDLGVQYDRTKLATDINYNVRLGSFYIKKLIDRFNGSEMLAIASYNAGPNATQRWINEFYDPRTEKDIDKVVDWIELITYAETRNYVQRITENLIVYKYLMSRTNYDNIQ